MPVKFEQNCMVQTTRILSFLTKKQTNKQNKTKQNKKTAFYNHFWQWVDAILEDVSVAEIILTLNCIRYPALPLVHNGGVPWNPPRENHFPTGIF